MGQTDGPVSLWIPELNTNVGSLHTLLAQMQQSVADNIVAAKAELTAEFPEVNVVSSGSPETLPANTYTTVRGGTTGWATAKNNTAAAAAGITVVTGVVDKPIAITKPGLYSISIHLVHLPNVGADFTQQCFTDLILSGSKNAKRSIVWSYSTIASGTFFFYIPAGSTTVEVHTWGAGNGTITSSEIQVWKVR